MHSALSGFRYMEHRFGAIILGFRDVMHKYYFKLTGQVIWQAAGHLSVTPKRTTQNVLHVYIKENTRAGIVWPLLSLFK